MPDNARARAVINSFVPRVAGFFVTKGRRRLVFDQLPAPVIGKQGELVGIDVMVRLFDGATEVRIDPHRVIINPPTVPNANVTFVDGIDNFGLPIRTRIVGAPDPEATLIEVLWDSVEQTPNPAGWRTRGTVTNVFAYIQSGAGQLQSSSTTY